jgi:hypothetical protein
MAHSGEQGVRPIFSRALAKLIGVRYNVAGTVD